MPTYAYIAKKPDGSETRGTIMSLSVDAAREALRKRGMMIEDLKEIPLAVATAPKQQQVIQPTIPAAAKLKAAPLPWSASNATKVTAPKVSEAEYAPFHETLRIFAGWLTAWYGLIYALGFLEQTGRLPALPFVRELFVSPLVLQFTFGTFLFLALSNIHRWIGGRVLAGFFLGIVYVGTLAGFVVYG